MNTHAPDHAPSEFAQIPKGRIGRFIVEREIGQGSIGAVYLFRDPLIGRKVAIKVLNPKLPADQRRLFEKNFIQEARAAGRLNHPNIITVYDADKSDDLLFIAMEYLEGKELSDLIRAGHGLNYKQIADLVARVANALDYAHRNGVIHRDIKPANIFIVGKSTPKVLDFGIASASRQLSDPDATLGGDNLADCRLLGTPNYMSPEQARGEVVDGRTDIFSLGVVLYQLLCGELPFKGDSIKSLLESITRDPPIPPQEIRPDIPLRLAAIAAKALAKKPADRYATGVEMAYELNRFLAKERTNQIIAKLQKPDEDGSGVPQGTDRRGENADDPRGLRRPLIIGMGIGVAVTAAVIAWAEFRPAPPIHVPTVTLPAVVVAPPLPAPIDHVTPEPVKPAALPPSAASSVPAVASAPAAGTPAASKPPKSAEAAASKPAVRPKPKPAPEAAPAPAVVMGAVQIAVAPWGEVFVDGNAKGVAPPLSRLSLSTGPHRIEIRNGEERHVVNIEVTSDKEVRVSHRF